MARGGVTRKREATIAALLTAPTLAEAAKEAGVSLRTLKRWLKQPEFSDAYQEAKREMLGIATGKLRRAMGVAVTVLTQVAIDRAAPAAARVTASGRILELGLKAHEIEDLEHRIMKLEAGLEAEGK